MSDPTVTQRPWAGFALVGFAYVIAHLAAWATVQAVPGWSLLAAVALADTVATIVVFVFSRAFNNTSVYDPYWSVVPFSIALWLATGPGGGDGLTARQGLLLAVIFVYAVRLTFNWARGWAGLSHEDWRYVDMRQKTGKAYWLVSFTALHFFPTVMTYLGCLPLYAALVEGRQGFWWLDLVAAVVTLAAVAIEGLADLQLRDFRRQAKPGDICDVGLWKYSRHPNYFGELGFWVGLWLFGVAAGAPWWTVAGVVAMVALFLGASIPMAEKRSLARRPHYAEHQRRVSRLVPWFPKKA